MIKIDQSSVRVYFLRVDDFFGGEHDHVKVARPSVAEVDILIRLWLEGLGVKPVISILEGKFSCVGRLKARLGYTAVESSPLDVVDEIDIFGYGVQIFKVVIDVVALVNDLAQRVWNIECVLLLFEVTDKRTRHWPDGVNYIEVK